jgi:hypothetical protein
MATNPTPFDLNRALQAWRENLGDSPAFRQENLDELETHLRDSIANLQQRGLAEDEAFLIASRRVGNDSTLGAEFGKINAQSVWINRILWMLIGTQLFGCLRDLVGAVTSGTSLGILQFMSQIGVTSPGWTMGILFGFIHLSVFALALAGGWWLFTEKNSYLCSWFRTVSKSPVKLIGSSLILTLVPPNIQALQTMLMVRNFDFKHADQLFQGISYGTFSASLIEGITLLVLTLLLARKQMPARN